MFIPRFETLVCDGMEAQDVHHKIRYEVFCRQTGFEDANNFPDQRERDEYDAAAIKFLMWDRMQRRWMAAMRLIRADQSVLPSERICGYPLKGLDSVRRRSVEFSRLAILKPRLDDPCGFCIQDPHVLNPFEGVPISFSDEKNEALLRLLWATFQWGMDHDIDYCYGIITSALSRMLKSFGVPLEQVGTEIRHRGVRRPYRYNVHVARAGLIAARPKFALMAQNSRPYRSFSSFRAQAAAEVAGTKVNAFSRQYAAGT